MNSRVVGNFIWDEIGERNRNKDIRMPFNGSHLKTRYGVLHQIIISESPSFHTQIKVLEGEASQTVHVERCVL